MSKVILKPHRGNINTMNNDKSNIILQDGELFIEKQEDGSYKFKIGDGITVYSELPYSGGGSSSGGGDVILPIDPSPAPTTNGAIWITTT